MFCVVAVHLAQARDKARKFKSVLPLQLPGTGGKLTPAPAWRAMTERKHDDVARFLRRQAQRARGKRGFDPLERFVKLAVAAPQVDDQHPAGLEA